MVSLFRSRSSIVSYSFFSLSPIRSHFSASSVLQCDSVHHDRGVSGVQRQRERVPQRSNPPPAAKITPTHKGSWLLGGEWTAYCQTGLLTRVGKILDYKLLARFNTRAGAGGDRFVRMTAVSGRAKPRAYPWNRLAAWISVFAMPM
jgi:hypothetical protein